MPLALSTLSLSLLFSPFQRGERGHLRPARALPAPSSLLFASVSEGRERQRERERGEREREERAGGQHGTQLVFISSLSFSLSLSL